MRADEVPGAAKAASLIPPRPNLGPEPFQQMGRPWSVWVLLGLAALAGLWGVSRLRRRIQGRRVAVGAELNGMIAGARTLGVLSGEVRMALVGCFGEPWRAKTTEEISEERELAEVFGEETAERLVALLKGGDLEKFGVMGENEAINQGVEMEAWEAFVVGFSRDAGARSRMTGR